MDPLTSRDHAIADGLKLATYGGEAFITFFVSVSRPFKCLLSHGYKLHVVLVEKPPIRYPTCSARSPDLVSTQGPMTLFIHPVGEGLNNAIMPMIGKANELPAMDGGANITHKDKYSLFGISIG